MGRRAGTPWARAVNGVVALIGIAGSASASGAEVPKNGTWSEVAPMPQNRTRLAAGVVDGKLYAVGGFSREGWEVHDTVEVYDPADDTWAPLAPMSSPRSGLAAGVVDGKLYAMGGWYQGQLLSTVEALAPRLPPAAKLGLPAG